ncbi:hypothetical protein PAHAL_9G636500 [Panicum hallii]|uniref:Myb-like domain-containing protein n=1 Tax=Panicum hallii TaxID=206008 RepID=A0A2T8I6T1_9POAL|nr:uncharacterized protein LOC112874011 isoform X1 [Panicum hallii]PVH33368.1 hypothetical protein PAHAL_9G636500 [Panicum hallii]
MEEGGFDFWNIPRGPEAAVGSPLPPPSSGCWAGINDQCPAASPPLISADGSCWPLDLSMLGGDDMLTTGVRGPLALEAEERRLCGHQWIHGDGGLPDQAGGRRLLDVIDSPWTSQAPLDSGSGATNQLQAGAHHRWGMDCSLPVPVTPPAGTNALLVGAPATGPSQAPPEPAAALREHGMVDMMKKVAEMVRTAEEFAKDEAASRVWSEEEHRELLYRLQWYAKHDSATMCINIAFHLPNKTAKDVALRWRWLQNKEKIAKNNAELVEKDSSGVKVKKGQGTKGANKNNNMYPLSKEALDSKSTRELLRDSHIFMQQIEENIKAGELGNDTADYFHYVKTNMDAIVTREKEFCRISIPMPPIDEQGLEKIRQQSRHSSSKNQVGKKGA